MPAPHPLPAPAPLPGLPRLGAPRKDAAALGQSAGLPPPPAGVGDIAPSGRSPWSAVDGALEPHTSIGALLDDAPIRPVALDASDLEASTRAAAPDDLVGPLRGPVDAFEDATETHARKKVLPPEPRRVADSTGERKPHPDPARTSARAGEPRPRTDDLLVQGDDPHTMLGMLSPLSGPSDPEATAEAGESTRLAPAHALAGPELASDLDLSEPPNLTHAGMMVYGAPKTSDEPASGARSAPGFVLAPDFHDDAPPPWEVRAIEGKDSDATQPPARRSQEYAAVGERGARTVGESSRPIPETQTPAYTSGATVGGARSPRAPDTRIPDGPTPLQSFRPQDDTRPPARALPSDVSTPVGLRSIPDDPTPLSLATRSDDSWMVSPARGGSIPDDPTPLSTSRSDDAWMQPPSNSQRSYEDGPPLVAAVRAAAVPEPPAPPPRPATPAELRNPRIADLRDDLWAIPQDETRAMPREELSSAADEPAPGVPPAAPVAGTEPLTLTLASQWRQWLAHAIDLGLIGGVLGSAAFVGLFGEAWMQPLPWELVPLVEALALRSWPLLGLAFAALFVVGGALFTAIFAGSPGALLTGVRLRARNSGRRAGPLRILVRTILSAISLGLGGAGYYWAFVDRQGRTLHDVLSGMVMVRRPKRAPPP